MNFNRIYRKLLALPFLLAASLPAAQFGVTVNTSPNFIGDNLSLVFQVTNSNSGVNTATLSNFNFGSGTPNNIPVFTGNASGTVSGGITMLDTSNPTLARVDFLSGSSVTFNVNLTENYNSPGIGDFFGFNILRNGNPITSTDPSTANLFLAAKIGGSAALSGCTTFGTNVCAVGYDGSAGRGPTVTIGDPITGGDVPEPATYAMLGVSLAALALYRRAR